MVVVERESLEWRVRGAVRDVPDFPSPGVVFKDITPVLGDADLFRQVCDALASQFRATRVSHIAAVESRGFILGAPIAVALGAAFLPIRKAGKLPGTKLRAEYALEYGSGSLEVHADACGAPARVLVVDDVLATGGTAAASCDLVRRLGAEVVACAFLLELGGLNGRRSLGSVPSVSLIRYD